MCRFQKEISSKIQEKKASAAESSSAAAAAAAEVEVLDPSVTLGNSSGLDEDPDGTTRPLQDQDEEQQHGCGGQSVGAAC